MPTTTTSISIGTITVDGDGGGDVSVSVTASVANTNGQTPLVQFTDANSPTAMSQSGTSDTWTAQTQDMMDAATYTLTITCNGVSASKPYTVAPPSID